jgi:serine/threonine protein kinase
MAAPLTGQTVAGYPLEALLWGGACGELYQAQTSAQPIAIKVLRPDLRGDAALSAAVAAGWESTRSITHPNLHAVFGTGVDPQVGAYALEEMIKAKVLRQIVLDGTKLAWRDVLEVAAQIAAGLKALHDAGKTHGDLTSFSVLVTQDMDVKLEGAGGSVTVPRPVTELLPPQALGYLAPERLQGADSSPGADLYSLGCCLYFIISGQDPFSGRDAIAVQHSAMNDAPPPPHEGRQDIPEDGLEFLVRLMEKDPTRRYGKADDVIADIGNLKTKRSLNLLRGGEPARYAGDKRSSSGVTPSVASMKRPGSGVTASVGGRPGSGVAAGVAGGRPGSGLTGSVRPGSGITGSIRPGSGVTGGLGGRPGSSIGRALLEETQPVPRPGRNTPAEGMAVRGQTNYFGDLKTQVASTIPQSEKEKEGDDLFRVGSLGAAVAAWRKAWEGGQQHHGLRAKMELGERQLKRLEFETEMGEARLALSAAKFPVAESHAQKAIELADGDMDKAEAKKLLAQVEMLQAERKSMGALRHTMLIFLGVFFFLLLLGLFLWRMRPPEKEEPPTPPPAEGPR